MSLTPKQIIIIGAAIAFGLPVGAGIVVGHFTSPAAGICSGVIICMLILALASHRLKATSKQNKNHDEHKEE
jgi:hypothetical protein